MAKLSNLSLTEERETLILRLAEMAAVVRGARGELMPELMPELCLLDCDPEHWTAWGPRDVCCNCGAPVLPADTWHRLLTEALRDVANLPTSSASVVAVALAARLDGWVTR
jgi:hypothetical protein